MLELAALFLKLGTIGFGGPAVHIATMEEEVVQRRKWLSRERFVDLIGATNLIPGPNSTEMAIHIGYVRAGLPGLLVAGCSFIFPAAVITVCLAYVYVQYGTTPQFAPILYGVKPVVMAIILSAGSRLARSAVRTWPAAVIAVAVCALSMLGIRELLLIVAGGVTGMLWLLWRRRRDPNGKGPGQATVAGCLFAAILLKTARIAKASSTALPLLSTGVAATSTLPKLWLVGLVFLKVGAVLFGTGYVLIAYLQGELVVKHSWLSEDQLVDAIAIGQMTPGPILSTATFVGYIVMAQPPGSGIDHYAGLVGAVVATVGVFLPSFLFVAASNPLVPKLRQSRIASCFLDAVNAASMGLMAAITMKLAAQVLFPSRVVWSPDWTSLAIAIVAAILILRWKVPPLWLVLGGGLVGLILQLI